MLVDGAVVGEIGPGLCVLLGVARADDEPGAERLSGRVARLRVFENDAGKFDLSLLDIGGAALVVSQFTLIADTNQGNSTELPPQPVPNRPSRSTSASAPRFATRGLGRDRCLRRPHAVELVNDGPVTIVLDI